MGDCFIGESKLAKSAKWTPLIYDRVREQKSSSSKTCLYSKNNLDGWELPNIRSHWSVFCQSYLQSLRKKKIRKERHMEQPKISSIRKKVIMAIFVLLGRSLGVQCFQVYGWRSTLLNRWLTSQKLRIFVECNYFVLYFPTDPILAGIRRLEKLVVTFRELLLFKEMIGALIGLLVAWLSWIAIYKLTNSSNCISFTNRT